MKNQLWILLSVLVMGMSSHTYAAGDEDAEGSSGAFYGSFGMGTISFNESSGWTSDNSKSQFVTLGWGRGWGVEYTHSSQQGNDSISYTDSSGVYGGSYDFKTDALYGVYRTSGPAYLKAKAGYIRTDLSCKSSDPSSYEIDCSGGHDAALGLGFGMRGKEAYIEAELLKAQNDFAVASVGIGVHF